MIPGKNLETCIALVCSSKVCHKISNSHLLDHIFGMNTANSDIYNDLVKDFVVSSMNGVNSTIFAYGQTSSGKTYTMLGSKTDTGLMPLTIENIFNFIEK
jgi:centromeric protein E